MIRIVTVEHSLGASSEYVILQNQGGLRVRLCGHILMSEGCLNTSGSGVCHVFTDDVTINPGHFVIVATGSGTPRWVTLPDGRYAYQTYLQSPVPLWPSERLPLHIASVHHTFEEREAAPVYVSREEVTAVVG